MNKVCRCYCTSSTNRRWETCSYIYKTPMRSSIAGSCNVTCTGLVSVCVCVCVHCSLCAQTSVWRKLLSGCWEDTVGVHSPPLAVDGHREVPTGELLHHSPQLAQSLRGIEGGIQSHAMTRSSHKLQQAKITNGWSIIQLATRTV